MHLLASLTLALFARGAEIDAPAPEATLPALPAVAVPETSPLSASVAVPGLSAMPVVPGIVPGISASPEASVSPQASLAEAAGLSAANPQAAARPQAQSQAPDQRLAAVFDGAAKLSKLEQAYRAPVSAGGAVDLSAIDPSDTGGLKKKEALKKAAKDRPKLDALQQVMYADAKRRLLLVFQAMDTGGKDGTIHRLGHSFNPQGVEVTSFKKPTAEEAAHPYLWRIKNALARVMPGFIGIFNRSHYEDILVPTVINEMPPALVRELFGENVARIPAAEIEKRYGEINAMEKELVEQGWTVLKFFLYISKDEQKSRLEARRDTPDKRWKLSDMDIKMRRAWPYFMSVYERILARTNTPWAPWYIIPANNKWYRDYLVGRIVKKAMKRMDLKYPPAAPGLKNVVIPD